MRSNEEGVEVLHATFPQATQERPDMSCKPVCVSSTMLDETINTYHALAWRFSDGCSHASKDPLKLLVLRERENLSTILKIVSKLFLFPVSFF